MVERGDPGFWRQETTLRVPSNYSLGSVGFPDRKYAWTVQVMRCTEDCNQALDDNVVKSGAAAGTESRRGVFYWHPDVGVPQPTNTPAPTGSTPDRDI